jgi:hypothetical protein
MQSIYEPHYLTRRAHRVRHVPREPQECGHPALFDRFDKPVSSDVSGWFFIGADSIAPKNLCDLGALREGTPAARFGDLMIFHGSFHLPGYVALQMYFRARELTYLNPPNPLKAEALFHMVIELEPRSYTARIELGNYALKRQDIPAQWPGIAGR